MLINLPSTPNSFFTPIIGFIKQNQLRIIVSCVALGILCAGTIYWVWSHFWQNRRAQKENEDDLFHIFKAARLDSVDSFEENFEFAESLLWSNKSNLKKEPMSKGDEKTPFYRENALKINDPSLLEKKKEFNLIKIVIEEASPIFNKEKPSFERFDEVDENEMDESEISEVDDYLKELLSSDTETSFSSDRSNKRSPVPSLNLNFNNLSPISSPSLSPSSSSSSNLSPTSLKIVNKEKKDFCYQGVFMRSEGVKAALQECEKTKDAWIMFCNPSFIAYHFAKNDIHSTWTLYISIDPKQILLAWQILSEELDATHLRLHGQIYSFTSKNANQHEPGKEIILHILKADENQEVEFKQLLSTLNFHFSCAGIYPNEQAIEKNFSEEKKDIRILELDQQKIPYFSYKAVDYKMIADELWEEMTIGYTPILGEKNIARHPEAKHVIVKESYYKAFFEMRFNPLKFCNPFKNLKTQNSV